MRADVHTFFATTAKGLEEVLATELAELGLSQVLTGRGGVSFEGPLVDGYRACLWSRVASRVLLQLSSFPAADAQALYDGVSLVPWSRHLRTTGTLAVEATSSRSKLDHTHFIALKVKDAVVDQFRTATGLRPSIDTERPDLRIHVHIHDDEAQLSLDLSGESLHRRGWREDGAGAPLKESLAAGLLLLAGWPARAKAGQPFFDPMCGSGTLAIEAAWMAMNHAPGLMRRRWGFDGWLGHEPAVWSQLVMEAKAAVKRDGLPTFHAFDRDGRALRAAKANARAASLDGLIGFGECAWESAMSPVVLAEGQRGLLLTNPPYGERLGDQAGLISLYESIGTRLREQFGGWDAHVFTGNLELAKRIRLEPARRIPLFNGPIECRLLEFPMRSATERPVDPNFAAREEKRQARKSAALQRAEAFARRLEKNHKHLSKWAKREQVTCLRLYDRDIPEYAVAVDLYEGRWVHVAEYAPPKTVDMKKAEQRLLDVIECIPEVLGVKREEVFLKTRRRQEGNAQYEKLDAAGELHEVHEAPARVLVNFTDHLDTGLFLDHRPVRRFLGANAKGKKFLNLFAYTGVATLHAVLGGATESLSVDLSKTYTGWAEKNFALNGFDPAKHRTERADVLSWLTPPRRKWDLVFLDPPTYSRSKKLDDDFDLQRDHVLLLTRAIGQLAPGGLLVFSNNFRGFELDTAGLAGLDLKEVSRAMLPPDFERNPGIHRVWEVRPR